MRQDTATLTLAAGVLLILGSFVACGPEEPSTPATVIENATVLDGAGASARQASVRIEGDRITAVGDVEPGPNDNDRGRIEPGMYADLVLFDPETILDRATPEDPRAVSVGVEKVWINGELVYQDGQATGKHPGRVLRRDSSGEAEEFL